eukprot:4344031-Lingulodinium_polyedra.AAC.1
MAALKDDKKKKLADEKEALEKQKTDMARKAVAVTKTAVTHADYPPIFHFTVSEHFKDWPVVTTD